MTACLVLWEGRNSVKKLGHWWCDIEGDSKTGISPTPTPSSLLPVHLLSGSHCCVLSSWWQGGKGSWPKTADAIRQNKLTSLPVFSLSSSIHSVYTSGMWADKMWCLISLSLSLSLSIYIYICLPLWLTTEMRNFKSIPSYRPKTLGFCFVLFVCFWVFFVFVFVFGDRVSLCSPGCPGTHFVNQAGLKLRNLPASASQVLGLKACTTTAWH